MAEKWSVGGRERHLLETAVKAKENAHILWGFAVGAAVLAEDNQTYAGCNVQSQISGLGVCAERCAVDHAVLHGNKKIREVAVVIDENDAEKPRPCGACLQYILEFSKGNTKIIMAKARQSKILPETIEVKTIEEMLPYQFKI